MKPSTIAIAFPGQGAQRPGMGKDFHDTHSVSARAYEEASQALGWDVAKLCFEDDPKLNLTEFAQPCILTTEIAMLRALKEEYGLAPEYFGGHSLGEYTALVAAGVLSLGTAAKIVNIRGQLMQEACPVGMGAMTAVIGKELDRDVLAESLADLPVDLANINSPGQIVISGKAESMEEACSKIENALNGNAPRFVELNVSAPFHSRFMEAIHEPFMKALEDNTGDLIADKAGKVTSNFLGGLHTPEADSVKHALVSQLSNPVKWVDNMALLAHVADVIYEVGPNRPLRGFFKAMGVACQSIMNVSGAKKQFATD